MADDGMPDWYRAEWLAMLCSSAADCHHDLSGDPGAHINPDTKMRCVPHDKLAWLKVCERAPIGG